MFENYNRGQNYNRSISSPKIGSPVLIINVKSPKTNTLANGLIETIFSHFRPLFVLFPHYWPCEIKLGKNVKNTWRYYLFAHVHHKSRSYDRIIQKKYGNIVFFFAAGGMGPTRESKVMLWWGQGPQYSFLYKTH